MNLPFSLSLFKLGHQRIRLNDYGRQSSGYRQRLVFLKIIKILYFSLKKKKMRFQHHILNLDESLWPITIHISDHHKLTQWISLRNIHIGNLFRFGCGELRIASERYVDFSESNSINQHGLWSGKFNLLSLFFEFN